MILHALLATLFFATPAPAAVDISTCEQYLNTRVIVSLTDGRTREGYVYPGPNADSIFLNSYNRKATTATLSLAQGIAGVVIPRGSILKMTRAAPLYFNTMGGGALELANGQVVGPYGEQRYVSFELRPGVTERTPGFIISLDPTSHAMVMQVPVSEGTTLMLHEIIASPFHFATMRLSETSKQAFVRYHSPGARSTIAPPPRDSSPDVESRHALTVIDVFDRIKLARDPAIALGRSGLTAIYEMRLGSLPPAATQPLFQTPLLSARSYGMTNIEAINGENGAQLVVGTLEGHSFVQFPGDPWFRSQLNPDSLDPLGYRPKVYVNMPMNRAPEALRLIFASARRHRAFQMKMPSSWENLQRDDKVVLHFNAIDDAVNASRELVALLEAAGISGVAPAFTYVLKAGVPVSLGFDPPSNMSWRYNVATILSDAMKQVEWHDDYNKIFIYAEQRGVIPGYWVPAAMLSNLMNALTKP